MHKLTLIILLLTLCHGVTASRALASSGLALSPPTIELIVRPDHTITQNLSLQNLSQSTQTYQASLHTLIPLGQNGGSSLDPTPLPAHKLPLQIMLDRSELSDFELTLAPQASQELTLNLTTLAGTADQDHYYTLVFRPANSSLPSSQPLIGLPILLTITEGESLELKIELEDFKIPAIIDSGSPYTFHLVADNKGKHMLKLNAQANLTSWQGKATTFELGSPVILSQNQRELTNQDGSPLTIHRDFSRFGPHTFKLTLSTQAGDVLIEREVTLWFWPIKATLTIIILILITLATYQTRLRKCLTAS